jgi:hypothetical protein
MLAALVVLLRSLARLCCGHRAVALENLALRQQLVVFRRTATRPQLRHHDRLFWILLANAWRSSWIRGAPQRGFAAAIWSTSVRIAPGVLGRPGRVGVERLVQRRPSHWRCQRTTVSGCTSKPCANPSFGAIAAIAAHCDGCSGP